MSTAALARSRQSWRAAEARLYPLAMTDVDGYQRALVLVAAVCAELRAATTVATDLLECQDRAVEYVAAARDETGASTRGLDVDDIFGSAAALRDRELVGEEEREARLAAIEGARASGLEWADVHRADLGTRVPQLRIHVGTGWTILTELGGDPMTGAPLLLVTTARVDATTGDVSETRGDVHTVGSAEEWEEVVVSLQANRL